jgi:hypothetical protein
MKTGYSLLADGRWTLAVGHHPLAHWRRQGKALRLKQPQTLSGREDCALTKAMNWAD